MRHGALAVDGYRLMRAALGGAAGFLLFFVARGIALLTALDAASPVPLAGGSLDAADMAVLVGVVLPLIVAAAGLVAWTMGAGWPARWLAGLLALAPAAVCVYAGRSNYSPFNRFETQAFLLPVLMAVLVVTAGRRPPAAAGGAVLAWGACTILVQVSPAQGLPIAALGWLLIPAIAAGLEEASTRA